MSFRASAFDVMRDDASPFEWLAGQARDDLHGLGQLLIEIECAKLGMVLNDIEAVRADASLRPGSVVYGGLCSQVGRVAHLMTGLCKIGESACAVAAPGQLPADAEAVQLGLQAFVRQFQELETGLRRAVETDIAFLSCDADVLLTHPELRALETLQRRFSLCNASLLVMSARWRELADTARDKAALYAASLVSPADSFQIH
ncbi:hypothetical protein [Massilia sp. TS11]|uniref:hypothetical protein n=1 Tax=Massilia sp. TS11 TaxID=2908003 RepID=UPI001EDB6896|nr:hypothetical protein [Massilia sp. TS11]MCG2583597.1 hypothetical protein [Massilia sp. TS11]